MKNIYFVGLAVFAFVAVGCGNSIQSADYARSVQQEKSMEEANAKVGMPAITNFQEMKLAKMVIELRDRTDLVTYTYVKSEMTGKYRYLGQTIGYGLPYAAQQTSPMKFQKVNLSGGGWEFEQVPQPEPNGLFVPDSADATWIFMKDPAGGDPKPVYIEDKVLVVPFKLQSDIVQTD